MLLLIVGEEALIGEQTFEEKKKDWNALIPYNNSLYISSIGTKKVRNELVSQWNKQIRSCMNIW